MAELDLITQDFRKNLNKDWSFYHSYLAKMDALRKYLKYKDKRLKILDAGCGEGRLIDEFSKSGCDIIGLDANFSSDKVKRGDILKMPFKDKSFDITLCLDVIEHLNFQDQPRLIDELKRVTKDNGEIVFSIPNQAHLSSRVFFLFTGRLLRTAKIAYHPGDRPISEYIGMLKDAKLNLLKRRGIGGSIPPFFQLTQLFPRYTGWLYFLLKVFHYIPSFCFLNIIICNKK